MELFISYDTVISMIFVWFVLNLRVSEVWRVPRGRRKKEKFREKGVEVYKSLKDMFSVQL